MLYAEDIYEVLSGDRFACWYHGDNYADLNYVNPEETSPFVHHIMGDDRWNKESILTDICILFHVSRRP